MSKSQNLWALSPEQRLEYALAMIKRAEKAVAENDPTAATLFWIAHNYLKVE